jgi:hypothetical protein
LKDDSVANQTRNDASKMPLLKLTPDDLARDQAAKAAGINSDDVVEAHAGAPGPASGGGGKKGGGTAFHKRIGPNGFAEALVNGVHAVRRNIAFVMLLTLGTICSKSRTVC